MRYWGDERKVTKGGKIGRRISREASSPAASTRVGSIAASSRSGGSRVARGGPVRVGAKGLKGSRSSIAAGGSLKNYPFLRNFYRHQAQISDRVQRFFFFLVLAGILYAFLLGDGGFVRIAMLRGERAELAASIAELEHNEKLLQTEIDRLDNSDYYIEKVGREKFGYIKPGDRVYRLIPVD